MGHVEMHRRHPGWPYSPSKWIPHPEWSPTMWIEISCPKCGLNTHVNSRGSCKACRAVLVYEAARRVKEIDVAGRVAFLWHPDECGRDTVFVDDGRTITQERGQWTRVQGPKIILERHDRRRTARPNPAWAFLIPRDRRIS